MPLPSKTQISDAVEDSSSFLTPLLNGYEAETGILGPNHYSGGFCIVFPVCKGSHKKALRVWHTEIEKVKERYKNISSEIAKVKKSFLANVEYVSNGLLVGKDKIDIVLMDWLKGQSLKQYISTIIDSTNSEIIKKQKLNKVLGGTGVIGVVISEIYKFLTWHIANITGELSINNSIEFAFIEFYVGLSISIIMVFVYFFIDKIIKE